MALTHARHQGPVIASFGKLALAGLTQRFRAARPLAALPGGEHTVHLPPRDGDMVRDYIRFAGGDPRAWKGQVPPHLFAQWAFGLTSELLQDLPYPLAKVVNAGCRLEINGPIPIDAPLTLTGRLESVDDNGRRAVIQQRFVTGTPDVPDALVAYNNVLVPLGGRPRDDAPRPKRTRPLVPAEAREIGWRSVPKNAGFRFACLTGDFNPLHWVPGYHLMFGYDRPILHGFGTMAIALETLSSVLWAGDVSRLKTVEVRFTAPVKLPSRLGVYATRPTAAAPGEIYVGQAPGGPAALTGTFTTTSHPERSDA